MPATNDRFWPIAAGSDGQLAARSGRSLTNVENHTTGSHLRYLAQWPTHQYQR